MLKFYPVYENWLGLNLILNICIKFLAPKLMKGKKWNIHFFGGRGVGGPQSRWAIDYYKDSLQEECQNPRGIYTELRCYIIDLRGL